MNIKLFHDLSPQQLGSGFWQGIDGFFMGSYWYLRKKNVYDFVKDITLKGGLKKALGIDSSVIYIHGSDRILDSTSKDKFRMFIRPPLTSLREAICFNPDVIQIMDLPLDDKDDEKRVCEKLVINRDIVEDYDAWLIKNGFRSSSRYKDGLPKFSKFMLLGVCHGDMPDAYAEEAKFMMKYCEIIGLPIAGLLSRHAGLSSRQRYDYVIQVMTKVMDVVGQTRIIQCTPYDEKILTIQDGKYKIVKMGDLVQKKPKNAFTLSLNTETLRTEIKPILNFFALGKREMVKITFEGKKEITLTENSLLYAFREGKVRETTVSQLKVNDCVAVPLQIPSLDKEASFTVPPWIEGLYVAEGCPIGGGIQLAAFYDETKDQIRNQMEHHPLNEHLKIRADRTHIYNVPLGRQFTTMGKAHEKHFLEDRLSTTQENIKELTHGYEAGDGYIQNRPPKLGDVRTPRHRMVTTSERLIDELTTMFLIQREILGIDWIKCKGTSSINSKTGKEVIARHDSKCLVLLSRLKDRIPFQEVLTVKEEMHNHGEGHLCVGMRYRSSDRLRYGGRRTLSPIIDELLSKYPTSKTYQYAKTMLTSNIGWLRIKKIEKQGREEAFDIKVKGNPNYLAIPSGIFVHNCMGYGLSKMSEISRILELGRRYDATFWFESSTMIRNSTHARKLLSVNIKSPEGLEYVNIARVKGADTLTPLEVFRENNIVLKSILNQAVLFNG